MFPYSIAARWEEWCKVFSLKINNTSFDIISLVIYLSFSSTYFLVPSILVVWICYKIKEYFKKPVLNIINLELSSMSPIYSEVS